MLGCELVGLSNELLKRYMLECSMIEPIHVIKKEADSFALIHFKTEIDASTFYHVYCLQKKAVCSRLKEVKVNPNLIGNVPVIYSSFQVQPRITSSKKILCRCTSNPTSIMNSNGTSADPSALTTTTTTTTTNSNSNSNPISVTNSKNSNLNTPISNTINTNATGSTVDDWSDDIEAAKLKIRNSIKRKSKEIDELQKRLRILEQI